jgi:DNA-binding transcriptional LysR family regulator
VRVARGSKQTHLTEAGRAFLIEARRTLAAAEAARNAVASVQGVLTGSLTIGYVQAPDSYNLPALLARFHHAHPGVILRLRNVPSTELIEEVRRHTLDLAFVSSPGRPPREVQIATLIRSTMPLACPVDHRLAREVRVDLEEIASETFIDFVPGWGARVATDQAFSQEALHRATAFEVNDIGLCMSLVDQGLGVAFVPPEVAGTHPHLHYLTAEPAPVWHLGIAHLDRAQMSAAGLVMLDLITNGDEHLRPRRQPD